MIRIAIAHVLTLVLSPKSSSGSVGGGSRRMRIAEVALEGKASEVGGLVSGAGQAAEEGAGGGLAVGDE